MQFNCTVLKDYIEIDDNDVSLLELIWRIVRTSIYYPLFKHNQMRPITSVLLPPPPNRLVPYSVLALHRLTSSLYLLFSLFLLMMVLFIVSVKNHLTNLVTALLFHTTNEGNPINFIHILLCIHVSPLRLQYVVQVGDVAYSQFQDFYLGQLLVRWQSGQ